MHTYLLGLVKYCLIWILGLIRFTAWVGVSGKSKQALRALDARVREMGHLQPERRFPMRTFNDGVSFIINSCKGSKKELNSVGGGMVSRDWVPCLLLVLAVLTDELESGSTDILPLDELRAATWAATKVIRLFFWMKAQCLTTRELNGLRANICGWVVGWNVGSRKEGAG